MNYSSIILENSLSLPLEYYGNELKNFFLLKWKILYYRNSEDFAKNF